MGAVNDRLDLSYVGLPYSAGLSVRVRYVVTKGKSLLTEITLCHAFILLQKSVHTIHQAVGWRTYELLHQIYRYYYSTKFLKNQ